MDFMDATSALVAVDLVVMAGLFLVGTKALDDARGPRERLAKVPHRHLPWPARRRAYLCYAGVALAAVPLVLPFL